jgi:hypothetical protein
MQSAGKEAMSVDLWGVGGTEEIQPTTLSQLKGGL